MLMAKAQAHVVPADPGSNLNLTTYHHFGGVPLPLMPTEGSLVCKMEQRIFAP